MEASLRKITALCSKDFPDLFKNPVMFLSALIPVVMMLVFKMLYADIEPLPGGSVEELRAAIDSFLLASGVSVTAGVVPTMIVIYSIAEEKEKHTLRTLMHANVSGSQVLISKAIVSMTVALTVELVLFFIIGVSVQNLPLYFLIALVGTIPIVILSLLLGLWARDQMTAGLVSLPIVVFALLPMMATYSADLWQFARFTPCGGMYDLLEQLIWGSVLTSEAIIPLATTLIWIIILTVVFLFFYKRLSRDN